jgi:hypothetical protein
LAVMQLDEDDAETAPASKPKTKALPKTRSRPTSDLSPTVISEIPPEVPEKTVDVIPPAPPEPIPEVIAPEVKDTPAATATDKTPNPVLQTDLIDDSGAIRSNKILKWILIFLLVNSAVIAFFVFHDNKQNWFHRNKETMGIMDSVLDQLADSVRAAAADTALVFSEAAKTEVIDESTPPAGNLRYYIVAGCFRDEINADELVKSLKKMDFKAEKFGKIGNLYAVSFVSFSDKESAVKELKRIREEIHPDAWMTRF